MKLPKYRAWDHDDKKMWKVVAMSESIYGDCEDSYIKVCEFDKSPMDKETDIRLSFNFDLMQFTGLYDKNGKEIYEGDLLTDYGEAPPLYVEYSEEHGAYCFVDKFDPSGTVYYTPQMIYYEQMEVIGNIFEHKHLLEG